MCDNTRGPIAIFERYEHLRGQGKGGVLSFSYNELEMQEPVSGKENTVRLGDVFHWLASDYRARLAANELAKIPALIREPGDIARIALHAPWATVEVAFGD